MAHLLFIDESGQDHQNSPYEVLAGVAVEDRDLWNLIQAVQDAELRIFGCRYSRGHGQELKGKKLLKRKVFKHADMLPSFDDEERQMLAQRCLENGVGAGMREMAALAQAKLAYVREVFNICARFRCKLFACVVADGAVAAAHNHDYLRKDYAYLFERFFYFLEDTSPAGWGLSYSTSLRKAKAISCLNRWTVISSARKMAASGPVW